MDSKRKTETGVVVSNKMDKTVVVKINSTVRHPKYPKVIRISKGLKVHDAKNECSVGDKVMIVETRPLSKDKCWRLLEIVEKASE
ncbi:MAG: 30S ribosomal protein S17 [Nitrospinota bacterium]|nr:30S ribosomal protein S17 [Nitrospinota bacterium]